MKDVVIYARVSSKEQEKGYSIDAQLRLLRDYAQSNDFIALHEFIEVETAKIAGRTQFEAMLKFLQATPNCNTILVEKTDRLYRNITDWVTIDELQLDVHLVKEGTIVGPNAKSNEKFIHGIRVLMAKNYIDNLGEEAQKGMLEKALKGGWPSKAPFGYRNNKEYHTIEIDSEEAEAVQWLFKIYAEGEWSLKQVIEMFYECGFEYRSKTRRLHPSTLDRIYRNPFYYGALAWLGTIYKGLHTPIISEELWLRVQDVLDNKVKLKVKKPEFAYRGLMKCSHCGCLITAELQKGKYVYYRCAQGKGKCKANGYVKQETLDDYFLEAVKKLRISPELTEKIMEGLKQVHQTEIADRNKQVKQLRMKADQVQVKIDQTYNDHLEGLIDAAFWKRQHTRLMNERIRFFGAIDRLMESNAEFYETGHQILELARNAERLFLESKPEEKNRLLNTLLLNCTLTSAIPHYSYKKPFDIIAEGVVSANWQP
jgi:site-specific DNA recombinase